MFPPALTVLANFSGCAATSVVLICLSCMIVYIIMIRDSAKNSQNARGITPCERIVSGHNPFAVKLNETETSSLRNGCFIIVNSTIQCKLMSFWGVQIEEMFKVLSHPWNVFKDLCDTDSLFKDISLLSGDSRLIEPHIDTHLSLEHPTSSSFEIELGKPPRNRYPLVLVLMDNSSLFHNDIVCNIALFHVKDGICSGNTILISQYVRTIHSPPFLLRPLYISDNNAGGSHSSNRESDSSSECIVCQEQPINLVLLPCRHTCTCSNCFTKLDKCPICRSLILSYFRLFDEPSTT